MPITPEAERRATEALIARLRAAAVDDFKKQIAERGLAPKPGCERCNDGVSGFIERVRGQRVPPQVLVCDCLRPLPEVERPLAEFVAPAVRRMAWDGLQRAWWKAKAVVKSWLKKLRWR